MPYSIYSGHTCITSHTRLLPGCASGTYFMFMTERLNHGIKMGNTFQPISLPLFSRLNQFLKRIMPVHNSNGYKFWKIKKVSTAKLFLSLNSMYKQYLISHPNRAEYEDKLQPTARTLRANTSIWNVLKKKGILENWATDVELVTQEIQQQVIKGTL